MPQSSEPLKQKPWDRVTLAQFQRVNNWRKAQHAFHPLESWTWEAVPTLWIMGRVRVNSGF